MRLPVVDAVADKPCCWLHEYAPFLFNLSKPLLKLFECAAGGAPYWYNWVTEKTQHETPAEIPEAELPAYLAQVAQSNAFGPLLSHLLRCACVTLPRVKPAGTGGVGTLGQAVRRACCRGWVIRGVEKPRRICVEP